MRPVPPLDEDSRRRCARLACGVTFKPDVPTRHHCSDECAAIEFKRKHERPADEYGSKLLPQRAAATEASDALHEHAATVDNSPEPPPQQAVLLKGPAIALQFPDPGEFLYTLYEGCDGFIELRALPSRARTFVALGDLETARTFVREQGRDNLYLGVATRKDESGGELENCRHLPALFVDLDFKTTPEPEARAALARCPLAPTAVVRSGGGLHAYWFLREPVSLADDRERELAKALLRRLARYLGADLQAAEPARILRWPGGVNHKYAPPRPVVLESLHADRRVNLADFDFLPAGPEGERVGRFHAPERIMGGSRNDTLWREGRSLKARGLAPEAIRAALHAENKSKSEPPLLLDEVDTIARNVVREADRPGFTSEAVRSAPTNECRPVLVRLADVEPKPVTWFWRGRVPRGKLTLLVGDPGLGKSLLLVDLGARATRGAALPGEAESVPVGDVVILSAEDGPADTIRPRFDVAGADTTRVHLLRAVTDANGERPFTLASDLPLLEAVVDRVRPVLLVIDPVSAYLGDRDSYKDSEVRGLLAPLAALADRYVVAVVLIVHLGKNEQRRALYRALGSIAFVAASRSVLAVAQDPQDKQRRLVAGSKANLSGEVPGLAYRIVGVCPTCRGDVADGMECRACDVQSVARFVWEDNPVPGLDADRLLGVQATPDDREEGRDADEFLSELLRGGGMRATEVRRQARKNGIADRTLDRAKRRLKVRSRRVGPPGAEGEWWWSLPEPEAAKDATKSATDEKVAPLAEGYKKRSESTLTSPENATSQTVAVLGGALSKADPAGGRP